MADVETDPVRAKTICRICNAVIKNGNLYVKCSICNTFFHKKCVQKFIHDDVLICETCEADDVTRRKNLPVDPLTGGGQDGTLTKKLRTELVTANRKIAEAAAEMKLLDEENNELKRKLKNLELSNGPPNRDGSEDADEILNARKNITELERRVADAEKRASESISREKSAIADIKNCRVVFEKELSVLRHAVESEKLRCVDVETELAAVKSKSEIAEKLITEFMDLVKSLNEELAENEDTINQLQSSNNELSLKLSRYQANMYAEEVNNDPPLNVTATPFIPEYQEYRNMIRHTNNVRSSRASSRRVESAVVAPSIGGSNLPRTSVGGDSHNILNSQQATLNTLVIRQNLKSLPIFSGEDITKWAEFEECYKRATIRGEFDQLDNVERLRECLTGPARSHVAHLLYGENADAIMNELRFLYGRTEDQVAELFSRVDKLPMLKGSRDPNFSHFVQTVSDYVMRLKQLNMGGDLKSLTIVTNIAKKLIDTPYHEKWESLKERDPSRVHGLEELSELLRTLWSRLPSDYKLVNNSRRTNESDEDEPPDVHHVLAHVASCSSLSSNQSTSEVNSRRKFFCIFCEKTNHTIYYCNDFKSQPAAHRLAFVKENRMCYSCLKTGHIFANCPTQGECGIDGCKSFHNRVLHQKPNQENMSSSEGDSQSQNLMSAANQELP